jgi:pyruvate dehydrogenase E2 component (dihydrolipoamide acetyltransferase)
MKLHHALIAGLVACGFVLAQEAATTAPAAAPAAEKAAPAKAAPAKKEAVKTVAGTIVSVDAIANTVIIKTKKAEDTLTVNDKTVIKAGGKVVALADLKAETKVGASYKMEEGKMVAVKISEKPVAPAKVKAAPAPAAAAPAAEPAAPAAAPAK